MRFLHVLFPYTVKAFNDEVFYATSFDRAEIRHVYDVIVAHMTEKLALKYNVNVTRVKDIEAEYLTPAYFSPTTLSLYKKCKNQIEKFNRRTFIFGRRIHDPDEFVAFLDKHPQGEKVITLPFAAHVVN
jgi:hypothetical protein